MKITDQSASLEWITIGALGHIANIARTCYQSEPTRSDADFVQFLMKCGHMGMIEHVSASLRFVTDRGISHELVRHRLFSFAQESTRYCNYSKGKFGNGITVVRPMVPSKSKDGYRHWLETCRIAEKKYFDLLERGWKPQDARAALPTSTKTEIVMTGNFRNWLWFLKLREDSAAHPMMRELAGFAHEILSDRVPEVFNVPWKVDPTDR